MLSIGDLSRHTGVKVPTIRYYEQIGMLTPPDRSSGNQRRYEREDLDRLSFIKHARDLGMNLNVIRDLIDLSSNPERSCAEADRIARDHLASVRDRIAQLRRLEAELERIAGTCCGDTVGECYVIRSLSNHALCETEH